MTERQLIRELSRAVAEAGGHAAFARKAGITRSAVSMTLSGLRRPADEIANALGYVRVISVDYRPIRPGEM